MNNWYQKIEDKITDQLRGTREKDLYFFRIEEFFRMAKRVDEYAGSCRECNSFRYEIEKISDTIASAVKSPGKNRIAYDRLQGKLAKHMRKQHGFYPPFYFTYLYAILYATSATVFAFLLSMVFSGVDKWFFLIPAFTIGLISGNIAGTRKDQKIRNDQKLL